MNFPNFYNEYELLSHFQFGCERLQNEQTKTETKHFMMLILAIKSPVPRLCKLFAP